MPPGSSGRSGATPEKRVAGPEEGPPRLDQAVMVSNRGPLAFRYEDGQLVPAPVGGGLAGSLRPLLVGTGITWVACALGPADRAAAKAGLMQSEGMSVELVDIDPDLFHLAYNVVSNATLWFCHHHLGSPAPADDDPERMATWARAWAAYKEFNRLMAHSVAAVAPQGGTVLAQDYHLALMGRELGRLRPDLASAHFTHTPFAGLDALRSLPGGVAAELLEGLGSYGACGFHSARWANAFLAARAEFLGPDAPKPEVYLSPLSTDPALLEESVEQPAVADALATINTLVGDPGRKVIVRVDRMELSKNLVRGFLAYGELLERHPEHHGRVVFLAMAYPTRQDLVEYQAYEQEVAATVAAINERFGREDWRPIELLTDDNYPRSLAALTRYDVLLVNPTRDGLNLVAKEGPLVNERHGVLVLSREAGAYDELAPGVVPVDPFDVQDMAEALQRALVMPAGERRAHHDTLNAIIRSRHPRDWLNEQLVAARIPGPRR